MAYKSQPTVTRPANTTAYTAGDVVGGAIRLDGLPEGQGITDYLIASAALRINIAAIPSGMTSFRVHLYDGKPASDLADNAAWDMPSGDRSAYQGYIDVGSPADVGSSLYCQVDAVNKPMRTNSGGGTWCYIVTNGAFTPAGASEVYVPSFWALDL